MPLGQPQLATRPQNEPNRSSDSVNFTARGVELLAAAADQIMNWKLELG